MDAVTHRLVARNNDRTLTRCGLEQRGLTNTTAWHSDTTCPACLDPTTPWPMRPGIEGERAWFAGREPRP